jgi:hypothetical protein
LVAVVSTSVRLGPEIALDEEEMLRTTRSGVPTVIAELERHVFVSSDSKMISVWEERVDAVTRVVEIEAIQPMNEVRSG